MAPDMFDKTKAHRETFNAGKDRDEERAALPVETQAKLSALEKERAGKLTALTIDQERRTGADMKTEMQKASLEKPALIYVPKFVSNWRNSKAIEREAAKSLEIKYAKEKADAVREIDREIKDLTKPEREERSSSPAEASPDFAKVAGNDNWQAEEIEHAQHIEAQWEAERDARDYDLDTGREK